MERRGSQRRGSLGIGLVVLLVGSVAGCQSGGKLFARKEDDLPKARNYRPEDLIPNTPSFTDPKKVLVDFAEVRLAAGDYDDARKMLQHAIDQDPEYASAYACMGRLYNRLEQPERALGYVATGLKHAPKDGGLWNEAAVARATMGEYVEAIASARKAVAYAPHNALYIENLAGMLAVAGEPEQSYELYARVMSAADARFRVAGIQYRQGNLSDGMRQLQLALIDDPDHAPAAAMLQQLASMKRMNAGETMGDLRYAAAAPQPARLQSPVRPASHVEPTPRRSPQALLPDFRAGERTFAIEQVSHTEAGAMSPVHPATPPQADADSDAERLPALRPASSRSSAPRSAPEPSDSNWSSARR